MQRLEVSGAVDRYIGRYASKGLSKLNKDRPTDVTCFILFFVQHVSNASTFISRSLRLCVGILLWFDVCWRYGVVRLG